MYDKLLKPRQSFRITLYFLLFHCTNDYVNGPLCYVIHSLAVLLLWLALTLFYLEATN